MDLTYIILCGGLSTRNFPHSKGIAHKSLLPFGSLRIIDYILKDIFAAGGKDIVFVCQNEKAIEKFKEAFEPTPEIEKRLKSNPKTKEIGNLLDKVKIPNRVKIRYIVQKKPRGNGHAFGVGCRLAGNKDAVMIFPDDLYLHKDPKKMYFKKMITAFGKNKKQIMITGIKMEDVSNNSILEKGRLIEKPKIPTSNIGGFSPMIFPKELCSFMRIMTDEIDKGKKIPGFEQNKEYIYTDMINAFLDVNEKKGFKVKMYLKDDNSTYMDTGNLVLYEQALLYSLLNESAFKKEHMSFIKNLKK